MTPLESSKLFRNLAPVDFARVRRVAQERSFAPNEPVFKEGDPGDGIYVVKDGAVNLTKVVVGGEARRLSRAQEGDLFGEMAVLDDNPRSLGAWAEGNTTVYFIPRPELLKLLSRIPRLAVAIVRDTCQRIRDFNEKYVKEVLEAEKLSLVGRFASSIAHDLKNPLNIIGISADLACLPSSTEVSRQASQVRIRKQVDRISNMVNELLEFVQGSHTSFILARLDYSAFVLQLIEESQSEAALKSVTLELVNPPPSVPVRINPQRLARVFHNFIGNAADAMPDGGKVRLSFSLNGGNSLVTELHDTGRGIAPPMLDRLFQAFATHGKPSGTGLGLAICKRIIQDHHGAVFAHNAPEGGAVFGFTLPVANSAGL
ncbi:MAG: ATP-binding protein [Limisphaerales bacterium]